MSPHARPTFHRPSLYVLIATLIAPSAFVPAGAFAQDNGIYIGASASDVSTDYDWRDNLLGAASDDDTSGYKLIGGVRPLDRLAIEANYTDFGTAKAPLAIACPAIVGFPCPSQASIDANAVSVSVLGFATLPLLDFYGRLGIARWQAEGDVHFTTDGAGLTVPSTRRGTDPTLGVGLQFRFASIALRAEYEYYEILDESADAVSIGFTYTFL